MVHVDGPVLVYMHQSARLIKMRQCKTDPEFNGCQGQTFLEDRVFGVPVRHAFSAVGIGAGFGKLRGHVVQDEIFNPLTIMRFLPSCRVVVIAFSYLDRVFSQRMRDVIQDAFDAQHTLWSAKAAKGCGRLGVGFQAMAFDAHVGNVIGIIGVQHGAVGHRKGQIH